MEKMDGTLQDIFLDQLNINKSVTRLDKFLEFEDIKEEELSLDQKKIISNLIEKYGEDYKSKISEKRIALLSKKIDEATMLKIWLEFLFQICCGLFFLQDKLEFNHNDMKMDNIFFKFIDPESDKITNDNFIVFIGDFGFSRFKIGDLVSEPNLTERQRYDNNFDLYLFLLSHIILWDGKVSLLPDGLYDNIKTEAVRIIEFCKESSTSEIEISDCLKGGHNVSNVLELYQLGKVDINTNPINVLKYLRDEHSFDIERCKKLFCKDE